MFEDLFSSSKGPGLIGLLLGLVVLAGFCGLGMAVFDGRFNGENSSSVNKQVLQQTAKIKTLEARAKQLDADIATRKGWRKVRDELGRKEAAVDRRNKEETALKEEVSAAGQAIEGVRADWEAYKEQYRTAERARAVGETLGDLKTADGKVYEAVEIREVTDSQIAIRHKSGLKRINWDLLPPALHDRFQFDVAQATAEQEKDREDEKVRTVDAEVYRTIQKAKTLDLQVRRNADLIRKKEREINGHKSQIRSNEAKIPALRAEAARYMDLHNAATSAGRPSSHLAKVNEKNAAADRLNTRNSDHQRGVSRLTGEISNLKRESTQLENEAKKLRGEAKARLDKIRAEAAKKKPEGE